MSEKITHFTERCPDSTPERRFAPVIEAIDALLAGSEEILMAAIDGRSGSGKSTLASFLLRRYPDTANLFHLDDFFPQEAQRSEERMAEIGGNLDYERFREEVLIPVWYGDPVIYRPFDCHTMRFPKDREQTISAKRLNLFEGSYSCHPYFGNPYQLRIFLTVDTETQLKRLRARVGDEGLVRFRELWIPKEEAYFERFRIMENADLVL